MGTNLEWRGWFGRLAPQWAVDASACWVNNPRDMINIQNAYYWARASWNNGLAPYGDGSEGTSDADRKYWGWNEIPVSTDIDNPENWDAVIIKLPANLCDYDDFGMTDSVACLGEKAQSHL